MIILGTNSIKDTGYEVANSCRFNGGSSDSLNRTLGTPTNNKKYTISIWVKKTKNSGNVNGNSQSLLGTIGGDDTYFEINNSDQLFFGEYSSSAWQIEIKTDRLFRDVSAWYHIVLAVDTTQGTESNRVKLYINGVQETSLAQTNYPSQNFNTKLNSASNHYISNNGNIGGAYAAYLEGYLSEYVLIDGQALAPTDFGEFDADSPTIWKPIDVSGLTFGTNGFYLDFEDSSALGNDAAGSNNFTVNNLTAVDQSTDTCTNNFATSNPLIDSGTGYSQGNLDLSFGNGSQDNAGGTFGVSKGKWYWEHKIISSGNTHYLGIKSADSDLTSTSGATGTPSMYYSNAGNKVYNSSSGGSSYGSTFTDNDIIGIALDLDNNAIWFSKNGSWQNSATQSEIETGTTTNAAFSGTGSSNGFPSEQVYLPWIVGQTGGAAFTMTTNFGSPTFSISSGNADGNGYGNFEYSVPSGYYALNTKNLAEYG
jgi:hypothetical protein